MKICILGSYSDKLDEGMANVSYSIHKTLSSKDPGIYLLNLKEISKLKFWKKILADKPHIVHLIPGPTVKGLLFLKLIQLLTGSKIVVSATKPALSKYFRLISHLLKPDIVIVQSRKSEDFFKNANYKVVFVPNGVDTDRFVPVDSEKKMEIRKKYGFNEADFIILHVGPLREGRNQKSLLKVRDAKILLIVSISNPSESHTYEELLRAKITVWREYFHNIQEIYAMSDLYIFPVFEELNSIEIPLSVLEAMSCNLPVIATRYGALERILKAGDGLIFIDEPNQIEKTILEVKNSAREINTRKKILNFSWHNVATNIYSIYESINTS